MKYTFAYEAIYVGTVEIEADSEAEAQVEAEQRLDFGLAFKDGKLQGTIINRTDDNSILRKDGDGEDDSSGLPS